MELEKKEKKDCIRGGIDTSLTRHKTSCPGSSTKKGTLQWLGEENATQITKQSPP